MPDTDEQVLYKTATVCRLTGYSPLVLRAWERRHGLLEPQRAPSGHRMYTHDDVRVLQRARELTGQGLSISEVAAMGRNRLLAPAGRADEAPSPPPRAAASPHELRSRLVRAAMVLDPQATRGLLDESFERLGETQTIAEVIRPALYDVGVMWENGRISVAAENVFSQAVRQRLLARLEACPAQERQGERVICACVEQEQHDLGALVLSLALARAEVPVIYLGPALPLADLETACSVRSPRAVCLSFKQAANLEPHRASLHALAASHPHVLFVVGGEGATASAEAPPPNLRYEPSAGVDDIVPLVAALTT